MEKEILGIGLIEWIGYLASLIILVSYLMKNVSTLRIVGTFGCILFVIYGVIIDGWPIVITNGAIVFINLYFIFIKKK